MTGRPAHSVHHAAHRGDSQKLPGRDDSVDLSFRGLQVVSKGFIGVQDVVVQTFGSFAIMILGFGVLVFFQRRVSEIIMFPNLGSPDPSGTKGLRSRCSGPGGLGAQLVLAEVLETRV